MLPKNLFNHIPVTLTKAVKIRTANSRCIIYDGEFSIKTGQRTVPVKGHIYFSLQPGRYGAGFAGDPIDEAESRLLAEFFNEGARVEIYVDANFFGKGFIRKLRLDDCNFEGRLSGRAILGDNTRKADKVLFSVPNLRPFQGTHNVRQAFRKKGSMAGNRIILESHGYVVTLDKLFNSEKVFTSLEESGGFEIMYNGQLEKKGGGEITFEECGEIIKCLNRFLSFVNGRRVSVLFMRGMQKRRTIWSDFTNYRNDPYKNVLSWSPDDWTSHHSEAWVAFCDLFFDERYRTILSTAIYWYVEANGNNGIEARSVLAQSALELIYNWLVEENQLSISSEIDQTRASGKLRSILEIVGYSTNVPQSLKNLDDFLQQKLKSKTSGDEDTMDACSIIVQIRNALVHSDDRNRRKLKKIPDAALAESVNLSMVYIELAILFILKYRGKYSNRCEMVPWKGMENVVPWAK